MRIDLFRCLLLMAFMLSGSLWAQFNWEFIGPDNLGSKTRALAFQNDGAIIAGSEGGGLWRSEDQGISWQSLESFDGNPNVTSIAVNGDRIYVATGATNFILTPFLASRIATGNFDFSATAEGFIGYLGLPGEGVYVSLDNGSTWSNNNGTTTAAFGDGTGNFQGPFVAIQKIISEGDLTLIATRSGLYVSQVPDLSVIFPASGNSPSFFTNSFFDVEFGEGNVIYASTADSLYRSTTGGITFEGVRDPALFDRGRTSFQRMAIAVSPSQPQTVYVAGNRGNGELSGVWRSDDSGNSWRRYAPPGSPGFTPLGSSGRDAFTLEVFPDNPDELIVAGEEYYTFTVDEGWQPAADHLDPTAANFLPTRIHTVAFDPQNAESFFIGTDEQIARSTDRGNSFSLKTKGYEASLFYSVSSIGIINEEAALASSPFSGTLLNARFLSDIPSNQGFNDIASTDVGLVRVSYTYPGAIIVQGSDGGLLRSLSAGEAFEAFYGAPESPGVSGLRVNIGDTLIDRTGPTAEGVGLIDDGGVPRTPWVLEEIIPENLLAAGQETLQSEVEHLIFFCSRRYVWLVKNALGDPDGLQPTWNRLTNVLADGNEFLTAITASGDTSHTVYVGTSLGNIYRLDRAHDLSNFNADSSVVQLNVGGSQLPLGRSISGLSIDPRDPNRLIITYAGYGGNIDAFPAFVWYTENALSSPVFTPISFTLPKEPAYSAQFVENPEGGESILLVGTESGLFSGTNIAPASGTFVRELPNNIGSVPVYDIFVQSYTTDIIDEENRDFTLQRDNTIFIATHGRGMWKTSSLVFARKAGENEEVEIGEELPHSSIQLFPNPATNQVFLQINLPDESEVFAKVFAIDGKVVLSLPKIEAGENIPNSLFIDVAHISPGMYFLELTVREKEKGTSYRKTLKMVLSK